MATFTADAVIAARRFTADAWIMGERWRHHRTRDHFGIESDLYVVLSEDVGPYVAFTPIHYVLEDILDRLAFLEDYERTRRTFTADAWLAASGTYGRGAIFTDSVIKKTITGNSFTADARIARGGSFTANAYIQLVFTANAYIIP